MIARLAWLVLVLAPAAAAQSTWYVDAAAAAPGDGSLAAPFPTIQAGVDAAAHGDVVSVAPGEYEESVVIPQQTAIRVESQAGPLATTLRAAGPGAAFHCEHFVQVDAYVPAIVGFTVTDSDVGVSDDAMLLVQRCILTGNGAGTHGQSPFLDHSTVVGNDVGVREKGYGVVATHSIVWGNASWDYANLSIGAFGSFSDCVGLMKVQESGAGISFDHVLHGDPELWGPAYGELHLQPGSPCIDFAGPDDVGALEFDPAYGADFRDVGFALAGTGAAPALAATGYMFPGEPVVLQVTGGPAGGSAIVALGLSAAYAPLLGGTLVPVPDAVLAPLLLDGAGALTLPAFVWPAVLPSGTAFYAQAWVPDPGGPAGFAATNGLQATTP
jgi:hypothetical protein